MADNRLKLNEEKTQIIWLAGYTSAAEESNGSSFDSSQRYCRAFNNCQRPRRCVGQSAYNGRPHRSTQQILLLPHSAT